MRMWGFLLLLAAFVSPVFGQSTTQSYSGPTTQPADFPQRLLRKVISDLQEAETVSIRVGRRVNMSSAGIGKDASHERYLATVSEELHTLQMRRPDRFKYAMEVPSGEWGTQPSHTVLFAGNRLTIHSYPSIEPEAKRNRTGVMNALADAAFQMPESLVSSNFNELTRLFDPAVDRNFFAKTSNWAWLGEGMDNVSVVWRISFDLNLGDRVPEHWVVSISKRNPHVIVRIVRSSERNMMVMEPKEGVSDKDPGWRTDPEKRLKTTYRCAARYESWFIWWDLLSPIGDATFAPLRGKFTETIFESTKIPSTLPTSRP